MAIFYGGDSYCLTDVGLVDVQVTDPVQLIGQRLARRLQTPRGGLASVDPDASDYGWDVNQLLLGKMTPSTRATAKSQIENECGKDEQVISAEADVTIANGSVTIVIQVVSSVGPFTLTGNINNFSGTSFFIS